MKREEINWQEVQSLIDRFYDGTTTPSEEALLMEALSREDLPEALQTDAEVFRALAQENQRLAELEADVPQDFEERLRASIEEQERREQLSIAPSRQRHLALGHRHLWTSIAACLLLVLIATPFLLNGNTSDDAFAASDISQEEAEAYTAYALSMVSNTMKSGMMELDAMGEAQEQIRSIINDAVCIEL